MKGKIDDLENYYKFLSDTNDYLYEHNKECLYKTSKYTMHLQQDVWSGNFEDLKPSIDEIVWFIFNKTTDFKMKKMYMTIMINTEYLSIPLFYRSIPYSDCENALFCKGAQRLLVKYPFGFTNPDDYSVKMGL